MTVRINRRLIKVMMAQREWTIFDLAYNADLHYNTVKKVLDGAAFTSGTLEKLATALDVHPVDLIEAEGYSSPHMDAPAIPGAIAGVGN